MFGSIYIYHTQLAKMSFDKIFDITAGVYFNFYNIHMQICRLTNFKRSRFTECAQDGQKEHLLYTTEIRYMRTEYMCRRNRWTDRMYSSWTDRQVGRAVNQLQVGECDSAAARSRWVASWETHGSMMVSPCPPPPPRCTSALLPPHPPTLNLSPSPPTPPHSRT